MRIFLKVLLSLALTACHSDNQGRLDEARVAALDKRIDALEHAGAAQPQAPVRRPGPDASTVYYLPVHDTDVVRGPVNAKVTVVEAFDFACPFCAMSASIIGNAQKARPDLVRVVSKNYVVHPQVATDAAVGACAAQKQGRGAAFEEQVWQQAWTVNGQPHLDSTKLSAAEIQGAAVKAGAQAKKFAADLPACRDAIANEEKELGAVGVGGTPSFFINGRIYQGPRTEAGFLAAIDEAAKKADASGIPSSAYYDALMKDAKRTL